MSTGDSTLMMLLSLNLLLLVFFVLLNSMATAGSRQAKQLMAQVESGSSIRTDEQTSGESLNPGSMFATWRASVVTRLQGMVVNRVDLRVQPQAGTADSVEVDVPLGSVFDDAGKLIRPEIFRNMAVAAGGDSTLKWQVRSKGQPARLAAMLAGVATQTGHAEAVGDASEVLRLVVVPGPTAKPDTGLQVQQVGEEADGTVKGIDATGDRRE